jgi:hypothetical protein
MASEPPTEGYGCGMRRSRRSQRAKEADLALTGLQDLCESSLSLDRLAPRIPTCDTSQTALHLRDPFVKIEGRLSYASRFLFNATHSTFHLRTLPAVIKERCV